MTAASRQHRLTGTTTFAIDRGEPALRLEHKSAATGIQIRLGNDQPLDEIRTPGRDHNGNAAAHAVADKIHLRHGEIFQPGDYAVNVGLQAVAEILRFIAET